MLACVARGGGRRDGSYGGRKRRHAGDSHVCDEDDDDEIVAQEYEDLMHGANGLSNEEFRPRPSVTARRRQSVLPKREKAGADLGFLLTNQRDVREGAADADVSGTATRRKSSLGGKDRLPIGPPQGLRPAPGTDKVAPYTEGGKEIE